MGADTKASGISTTWKVLAHITGLTAENTKASTKKTRNTATEFVSGQMEANTAVDGSRANSTVLECTEDLGMISQNMASGRTDSSSSSSVESR